jgi:predicted transcriptional regulator
MSNQESFVMKVVTANEIAKKCGCTKQTVTRLARAHKIGTQTKIGWIFTPEEGKLISVLLKPVGRPRKERKP